MNRIASIALICALPLLGACADLNGKDINANEGVDAPHFGEALKRDMAAQIVHPDAPLSTAPQTMDGQRAAIAQDAYAKDKVKQPENVGVGSQFGQGGGSGSSSSSQ